MGKMWEPKIWWKWGAEDQRIVGRESYENENGVGYALTRRRKRNEVER